jgi:ubiquinone/menaquinone biosynthesis C-methylase UbiE
MQQLPYPSNQFDLVMSAHTLEHLAAPETGLGEMLRVVKPGGLILVLVPNRSLWGRQ